MDVRELTPYSSMGQSCITVSSYSNTLHPRYNMPQYNATLVIKWSHRVSPIQYTEA